jgi:hypothetical protein
MATLLCTVAYRVTVEEEVNNALGLSTWQHRQSSLYSIQKALLAGETYVYIAKASELDNKQTWNKQSNEQ